MTPNENLWQTTLYFFLLGDKNTNCGGACCSLRERNEKGRKEEGKNFNLLQPQPIPSYAPRRFECKRVHFFDNSQGYDWDAFPPICWFNRWKQISSFELDQSGFFPWKKILWLGFFLNFFGGVSFKKIALRLGNWKSTCAQSNKRIECLFGVLYSVLKKGFISKYDIYICQGNKFLGESKCNFFKTHFCDSSCDQKAMREREREIAIYIMALSYTQLEKLNGLKPLHVRLNLEFDMVKIKRVFCNFMNCCWTAAENKTTTHMQVQELQLYARIVTTAIM